MMNFQNIDGSCTQKEVQQVLEMQKLLPAKGLNLKCSKLKCFNCYVVADCKTGVKSHKCDLCKTSRQ